jgi:hypothetical protein
MSRKTFKGYDTTPPQTEKGAYKYPVPTHRVTSDGHRLVPVNSLGDGLDVFLTNSNSSAQNVDGSVTPVVFEVAPDPNWAYMITHVLFYFSGNGITTQNYCGRVALPNGVTGQNLPQGHMSSTFCASAVE